MRTLQENGQREVADHLRPLEHPEDGQRCGLIGDRRRAEGVEVKLDDFDVPETNG
jgi:hypothetical protein